MQGSIVLIYCPAFFDSNDLEDDCYRGIKPCIIGLMDEYENG